MGKFEEYNLKTTERGRNAFLTGEKNKKLESNRGISGAFDLGFGEVKDILNERMQNTTYLERTKYYFEDAGVMEAKAERYRRLADDGTDITEYARQYGNHSARKRKRSANAAADAFDRAASLEMEYKQQKADMNSLEKFLKKKEIMNERLTGMKKAAEVKSTSKENESYRILKAQISCLTILKDEADHLVEQENNDEIIDQLNVEIFNLEKDLFAAQNQMEKLIPSPVRQWEDSICTKSAIKEVIKAEKQNKPDINEESARMLLKLRTIYSDFVKPETKQVIEDLKKNKLYNNNNLDEGDISRFMSVGMRTVLKDKNGLPINKKELEKENHNKRWLKILSLGDVSEKNKILLDQFKYFESLKLPTPRELKEWGPSYFFKNDPAKINDIINIGSALDNLKLKDEFARQYEKDHPEFALKITAAASLATYLSDSLNEDFYILRDGVQGYKMSKSVHDENWHAENDPLNEIELQEYEKDYQIAYKDEIIRKDVSERLDNTEAEALKHFIKVLPDDADVQMRKVINDPVETKLGKDLLDNKTSEKLSSLTGDAYQKLFGKEISKMQKLQRAEAAVEKKKIQRALRNRLENFLIKRQTEQAKGLKNDLYNEKNEEFIIDEKSLLQLTEGKYNLEGLKFAREWTDIGSKPQLLSNVPAGEKSLSTQRNIVAAGKILDKLNLSSFEYKDNVEFVSKIHDNYKWIRKTDALRQYYLEAKKSGLIANSKDLAISSLEAKLKFFEEVKKDYDTRIAVINSPYYAIISGSDIASLSTDELKRKIGEYEKTDPEFATFLRNYELLKNSRSGFSKGASSQKLYESILKTNQQEAVRTQEQIAGQIKDLGLEKNKNESDSKYKARVESELLKKAQEKVPLVNSDYVHTNKPSIEKEIDNLSADKFFELEKWLETTLSDINKLKESGFNDDEINELSELRKLSYKSRQILEMQSYLNNTLGKDWKLGNIENPRLNREADKNTYNSLAVFFKTVDSIRGSFGLPKDKQKMSATEYYANTLSSIAMRLAARGITFTQDFNGVLDDAVTKAKDIVDKQKQEGKYTTITVGGRKYQLPDNMNALKKYDSMNLPEADRATFEEKLTKLTDLHLKVMAVNIIMSNPVHGVYLPDFEAQLPAYNTQIKELSDDIENYYRVNEKDNLELLNQAEAQGNKAFSLRSLKFRKLLRDNYNQKEEIQLKFFEKYNISHKERSIFDGRSFHMFIQNYKTDENGNPLDEEAKKISDQNQDFMTAVMTGDREKLRPHLQRVIDKLMSVDFSLDKITDMDYLTEHPEVIQSANYIGYLNDCMRHNVEYCWFFEEMPEEKRNLLWAFMNRVNNVYPLVKRIVAENQLGFSLSGNLKIIGFKDDESLGEKEETMSIFSKEDSVENFKEIMSGMEKSKESAENLNMYDKLREGKNTESITKNLNNEYEKIVSGRHLHDQKLLDMEAFYKKYTDIILSKEDKERVSKAKKADVETVLANDEKIKNIFAPVKETKALLPVEDSFKLANKTETLYTAEQKQQITALKKENAGRIEAEKNTIRSRQIRLQNTLDLNIAKKTDFKTVQALSALAGNMTEAEFAEYVKNYTAGGFDQVITITRRIFEIDPGSFDISSDEAIINNCSKLEMLSNQLEAIRVILSVNSTFRSRLFALKDESGNNLLDKLNNKLRQLDDISGYYRLRKLIIQSPLYQKLADNELSYEVSEKDDFETNYLKKLLRCAYYHGRRISGLSLPDLQAINDKTKQLDDYAKNVFTHKSDMNADELEDYDKKMQKELYSLEFERLFVPQDDLKISLDIPKENKNKFFAASGAASSDNAISMSLVSAKGKQALFDQIQSLKSKELGGRAFPDPGFRDAKSFEGKTVFGDTFSRQTYAFAVIYSYLQNDDEMIQILKYMTLSANKQYLDNKNDPEIVRYLESAFIESAVKFEAFMYAALRRLQNGIGDKPFLLHPKDLLMQYTPLLKATLTACATVTNHMTDSNAGRFMAFMNKFNTTGKYSFDVDEFENIGNAYSAVSFKLGRWGDEIEQDINYEKGVLFPIDTKNKIKEWCANNEKYREYADKNYVSLVAISEYLEETGDKSVSTGKIFDVKNSEGKYYFEDAFAIMNTGPIGNDLTSVNKLLNDKNTPKTSIEEIEAYEKKLKDQNYSTTGDKKDPYLVGAFKQKYKNIMYDSKGKIRRGGLYDYAAENWSKEENDKIMMKDQIRI